MTQTIDIPPSRQITLTVPETVPTGKMYIRVLFQKPGKKAPKPAYTPQPFPTLEELKEEAHRKYLERFKDGHDALDELCGCMPDAFGDAVQYQRELRDEWPD